MVFKERADIVFLKLEEGTFAVSTQQGVPVLLPPFAVIADADILYGRLAQGKPLPVPPQKGGGFHGNSQRLQSLRSCNDAAVAIGLFQEMFMLFHQDTVKAVQFLIPLHGSEISRSKNSIHYLNDNVNVNDNSNF